MKALDYFLSSQSKYALVYNMYLMVLCMEYVKSILVPRVVDNIVYDQWMEYLNERDEFVLEPAAIRSAYQGSGDLLQSVIGDENFVGNVTVANFLI